MSLVGDGELKVIAERSNASPIDDFGVNAVVWSRQNPIGFDSIPYLSDLSARGIMER